jgi:septal ring factor EnvC (AmiA/AmiB activator)
MVLLAGRFTRRMLAFMIPPQRWAGSRAGHALLILGLLALAPSPAWAQNRAAQPAKPQLQQVKPAPGDAGLRGTDAAPEKTPQDTLEDIRGEQRASEEEQAKLRAEIAAIGADRKKLDQQLVETAARVRDIETKVTQTEARLKPLDVRERSIRVSLDGRRDVMAEVLAALQRLGRHPPPALLVSPQDALQSVRAAIMLGTMLPEMRQQAEDLAGDLKNLQQVRTSIDTEHATLKNDLKALSLDRERLALLVAEKQKRQGEAENALKCQRARAAELAKKAKSLEDLIAKLDEEAAKNGQTGNQPENGEPRRMAPAIAFASARGRLHLPVNGVKLRDFGEADGVGGVDKGILIATRTSAQVTSPCDGWIAYAGPFRSYGQVLILNAGDGYHVVLMGMEKISVDSGQFVLTGEPVGVMGNAARLAAIRPLQNVSQPVLYVEFRKDGTPIDPSPWWAKGEGNGEGEKVRG